ncbi:hypothetical protein [Gluconacetobacter johannae]|uniref:Uncharacterized protein n=1 Tax=Gluconacetobacter johannae TaxID=112140 RepID=A0A7W4P438_9PROT|nr:hypothetical protein [Gluconacetobacter johannae]MBB2174643.1 hypothetical protein [Gluconacetobacter johannae]
MTKHQELYPYTLIQPSNGQMSSLLTHIVSNEKQFTARKTAGMLREGRALPEPGKGLGPCIPFVA